ncbi:MAG: dockerin type I repeat-containing protein [Clostridium sp.]|nr:dockerin type I repeat-containing protein [Clostridium sp.]
MKKNKFLCGLTAASIFIGASFGAFTASAVSETNYTLEELFAMSDEEFLALEKAEEYVAIATGDVNAVYTLFDYTEYGGLSGLIFDSIAEGDVGERYKTNITEAEIENLLGDTVNYEISSPLIGLNIWHPEESDFIHYGWLMFVSFPDYEIGSTETTKASQTQIMEFAKCWYCVNQVIDLDYYNYGYDLSSSPSNEKVLTGDVNLDKKIDVTDVEYMLMDMNGKIKFTDPQKYIADVNGDEIYDEKDIKELLFSMFDQGDVNMDENIDLYDAIRIAESMAKVKTLTDVEFVLADLNDNGKVDLYDAIEVAKIMINK